MKHFSEKSALYISVFIFTYILFLVVSEYFKIDFGYLTILLEILTIPIILIQFVLLFIVIQMIFKKRKNKYIIVSLVLLITTVVFTLNSFLK